MPPHLCLAQKKEIVWGGLETELFAPNLPHMDMID